MLSIIIKSVSLVVYIIKSFKYLLKLTVVLSEYILSPTVLIAMLCKRGKSRTGKTKVIKCLNITYYLIANVITFFLLFGTTPKILDYFNYNSSLVNVPYFEIYMTLVFCWAFSRSMEVFIAFARDAYSQLSGGKSQSSLQYYERISLAALSYIELIYIYGLMYFTIPYVWKFFDFDTIDNKLSVWESLYFSGVTITTLGYGDYSPKIWLSQFLSVFEVLNGFTLIVVSFAIYVSMSINNQESKRG